MSYKTTLRGSLSLDGATEHFYDYICGELNCKLNKDFQKNDVTENDYFAEATFDNGEKYEIFIYFDSDEKEWICISDKLDIEEKQIVI